MAGWKRRIERDGTGFQDAEGHGDDRGGSVERPSPGTHAHIITLSDNAADRRVHDDLESIGEQPRQRVVAARKDHLRAGRVVTLVECRGRKLVCVCRVLLRDLGGEVEV